MIANHCSEVHGNCDKCRWKGHSESLCLGGLGRASQQSVRLSWPVNEWGFCRKRPGFQGGKGHSRQGRGCCGQEVVNNLVWPKHKCVELCQKVKLESDLGRFDCKVEEFGFNFVEAVGDSRRVFRQGK